MSSLREWRQLRQIERSLMESDPDLAEIFRTETPPPLWYQRWILRVALALAGTALILLGLFLWQAFLVFLGFLSIGLMVWLAILSDHALD